MTMNGKFAAFIVAALTLMVIVGALYFGKRSECQRRGYDVAYNIWRWPVCIVKGGIVK
jgi:hypothetical protein